MIPVCRVSDMGIGICLAHGIPVPITVTLITGALTVIAEGLPVATVGSMGVCSCGHMSVALLGASTVLAAPGQGVHRIGDTGLPPGGTYNMLTGAATVFSGA